MTEVGSLSNIHLSELHISYVSDSSIQNFFTSFMRITVDAVLIVPISFPRVRLDSGPMHRIQTLLEVPRHAKDANAWRAVPGPL